MGQLREIDMASMVGSNPHNHLPSAFRRANIQMMVTTWRMVRVVWGLTATLYLTVGSLPSRHKSTEESFTVLSTRMFRARRAK